MMADILPPMVKARYQCFLSDPLVDQSISVCTKSHMKLMGLIVIPSPSTNGQGSHDLTEQLAPSPNENGSNSALDDLPLR